MDAREQDYSYDDDAEDFDEFATEQVNTGKSASKEQTFKQTPIDSSAVTFG